MLRPSDMDLIGSDEAPDESQPESALPTDDFSEQEPEPREHLPQNETQVQGHMAAQRIHMNMLGLMPTLVRDRAQMQQRLKAATDETERIELRDIIHELDEAIGTAQHGDPKMPMWGHEQP